jgi:hypothetical protein
MIAQVYNLRCPPCRDKYPLDVDERRNAVLAEGSLADRSRRFRTKHLAKLKADEAPVPIPKWVLLP